MGRSIFITIFFLVFITFFSIGDEYPVPHEFDIDESIFIELAISSIEKEYKKLNIEQYKLFVNNDPIVAAMQNTNFRYESGDSAKLVILLFPNHDKTEYLFTCIFIDENKNSNYVISKGFESREMQVVINYVFKNSTNSLYYFFNNEKSGK